MYIYHVCSISQVVYRVDDVVDVVYTVTNAVGPVSSRFAVFSASTV